MTRAIEIVRMVAPDARENYVAAFRNGDALLKAHDITTPLRLAHFLAQVLHETGGLTVERESGNYSAKRLLEIFGVGKHSAAVTPQEAERLAHDAELIFERVYGIGNPAKSRELGNTKPGDGFRYRGGGILQTTGRANYRDMGALCGVDFESQPELVVSAEHALKPALAEWEKGNLNQLADQDDILLITKRINGGTNGLAERRRWLARLRPLIKSVDFAEGASAGTPASGPTVGPDAAAKRGTGEGLLRRAVPHIGEDYVNRQVPKDDANWKGPWDCAEFVSWLVYQEAGILYGCVDNRAPPTEADAYTGAWRRDAERHGIMVSVEKAASTVGGIVLRYPPPGAMGHIAVCDGKGGTVEAKGKKFGVVADKVDGRTWHTGILIPGIDYGETTGAVSVRPPADIYARNAVNMDRAVVVELQKALLRKGFDPGEIDGDFGPLTEAAVIDFQQSEGLVVDGEVGRDTAAALGVTLTSAVGQEQRTTPVETIEPDLGKPLEITKSFDLLKSFDPKILASLGLGAGSMNPFVLLAAQVLPGIIQAVAGDKAGSVAQTVATTVKDVTGKDTAEAAADRLKVDPVAVAALQVKLAEIAAEQEDAKRQAQFAQFRAQLDADADKRKAELQAMQIDQANTSDARTAMRALAGQGGLIAWTGPVISYGVTLGFFVILMVLLLASNQLPDRQEFLQVINIVIGALTAAFATVINFWLGSSQGSRLKDVAAISREETQTARIEQATQARETTAAAAKQGPKPKPRDQLDRCLDIVISKENRGDAARHTKFGLTLEEVGPTLQKPNPTSEDLQQLTREQASEVYRVRYWNVLKCDELPIGVDLVVLDIAAETDVVQAAKTLQKVVGAGDDGSVGPVTLGAVGLSAPRTIVTRLSEQRREWLRARQTGATAVDFTRIDDVERAAREMIDRTSGA